MNRREIEFFESEAAHSWFFGSQLFNALFHGRLALLFERTRNKYGDKGLTLTIKLNPKAEGYDELRRLPWEFLYDPNANEFLATKEGWSVTRYLTVPRSTRMKCEEKPKTKVLAVAAPKVVGSFSPIPDQQHLNAIETAVGAKNVIKATDMTRRKLAEVLRTKAKDVGVLHILAHGTSEGIVLGVEAEDKEVDRAGSGSDTDGEKQDKKFTEDIVKGHDLARLIADNHPEPGNLRMVVLCSCYGGDQPPVPESDPDDSLDDEVDGRDTTPNPIDGEETGNPLYYAGTASALILAGFPNVIGMSHQIDARQATAFFDTFYERLEGGAAPSQCLTSARKTCVAQNRRSLAWGKVLLFSRADLRIFPFINWSFFKKTWTLTALAVLYLSVTIWGRMQGVALGLPTIEKTGYSASIYGFILFSPIFTVFLLLTHYHVRYSRGTYWYSRLPEFWGVVWDYASLITRWYQAFAVLLFFLIPGYLQAVFFSKYLGGTAYYYPTDCGVKEELGVNPTMALQQDLEDIKILLRGPQPKKASRPHCFVRLTYQRLDHFIPSVVIMKGDSIWDGLGSSHDYVYGEYRVTYFPIWGTYAFAAIVLVNLSLLGWLFVKLATPRRG
ncbi:CHAT domain-containing protein [Sulfidibacter corallicola]|uniref:CHAT domain-containing protein n=1 Tax=Sulfidibacter corallicola TaxID=2818388 RepID=A0A8A4TNI0_SULCO|nr:CHAT domain-containing protein [Sulfidibacter corallicola]QTD50488.1 CHAT domain-containing protein [Sulfidibacter corallicola]